MKTYFIFKLIIKVLIMLYLIDYCRDVVGSQCKSYDYTNQHFIQNIKRFIQLLIYFLLIGWKIRQCMFS